MSDAVLEQSPDQMTEEKPKATRRRTTKKATAEKPAAKAAEYGLIAAPAASAAASAESSSSAVTEEVPAPAPKKRGRPRKNPVVEAPASEADAAKAATADAAAEGAKQASADHANTDRPSAERTNDKPARANNNHRNGQKNNAKQNKQNNNNNNHRRQRRQHGNNHHREPVVPQTTKEDLEQLKVAELRAKADELGVEHKGLKKAELVEAVLDASVKAEGFVSTAGVLDILSDGYGFLRTNGYLPGENDVYVSLSMIRRNGLRKGDYITGHVRPARQNEKYAAIQEIDTVNGHPLAELGKRVRFSDLTPVFPDERLVMEHGKNTLTARVIDLCSPIGKGQRGLIVSPPKAGKTTILKDIAASITANNPEVHLMCLLVAARPEEVTDMQRSIRGEVIASTFDMPSENHIAVSEMVIERAKRMVEEGKDVVILLDSLTRLARAYNLAQPASGRILSGGVDSTARYPPKKFLGAARNIEGGGSLTILASALIDTGSKMDEVIFEEFKGTGNMEVKLDRALADRRIFPAIDPVASGTRREDLLLDQQEAPLIWAVRRILANRNSTENAMNSLLKSLQQTNSNQEFLIRAAKKWQGRQLEDVEL